MKVSVEIDTNHRVFDDNPVEGIREALRQAAMLANEILTEGGGVSGTGEAQVRDAFYNTVGTVKVEE